MSSTSTRSASLLGGVLLGSLLLSAPTAGAQTTGDYAQLTNTYRPVTNFNVETTRGMQVLSSSKVLWINTHGSRLCSLDASTSTRQEWPTLNNPIAVDLYSDDSGGGMIDYALVLGGGTHAIALHELANGRISALRQLPAETGDLVVDQAGQRVFVSLPGNNTVVQLSLPELELQATFTVASQRPRFLYLDEDVDPELSVVYVTPELSGNNTMTSLFINAILPTTFAVDLEATLSLSPNLWLPDEDLFRIDPVAPPSGAPTTQAAVPVLRRAGTLLMAHGINPATGHYWIVGTDSHNGPAVFGEATSEPELKGVFATNQLTIAPTWGGTTPVPLAPAPIDLDLVNNAYHADYSVGFPYALAFTSTGEAFIAGSTSSSVRIVDQQGARIGDLRLPAGSIPRHLAIEPVGGMLLVYCWGTNEIRIYHLGLLAQALVASSDDVIGPDEALVLALNVGVDPNLEPVRHGRALFYDGANSLHGRTTCNHCHPGGGMDLLGWNIHDFPDDHKELMVTQSLKSIEDTFPYHWRGERDLEAFNVAFAGLLGGAELGTDPSGEERSDFEDFKAFIFGLQAHANPIQDPRRILNTELATTQPSFDPPQGHGPGNPITGQEAMREDNVLFQNFSCVACHSFESGTVGDPQPDAATRIPGNANLDVAHLRQLFHKNQEPVTLTFPNASLNVVSGGFGMSRDGNFTSIFDFLGQQAFDITPAERLNLAAFIEQMDQGISPAAQRAYRVDEHTPSAVLDEIEAVLFAQFDDELSADHGIDISAIGIHEDDLGTPHELRWHFVSGTPALFVASDPSVTFPDSSTGTQTWQALKNAAAAGEAVFTLIGLPPGNGFVFALDADNDGATEAEELAAGSHPLVWDTDGDGHSDGHELDNNGDPVDEYTLADDNQLPSLVSSRVDHMGASYAKLVLEFSEPVLLEIIATNTVTGHIAVERRFVPLAFDTVTVQRLQPSMPGFSFRPGHPFETVLPIPYTHRFDVHMTDLSGNTDTAALGLTATTRDLLALNPLPPETLVSTSLPPADLTRVIEELDWDGAPAQGTLYSASANVQPRLVSPEIAAAYTNPAGTPNGSSNPYEAQVVIAQVLHFDSLTQTWSVIPASGGSGLTISAPTGFLHDEISFSSSTVPGFTIPIEGPFLLSTTSDGAGDVDLEFELDQPLPSGDRIKLNIIGIGERFENPNILNEFFFATVRTYNKPATRPEQRSISYP